MTATIDLAHARPKRFAPYPVWSKVRALGVLTAVMLFAGIILPVLFGWIWALLLLIAAVVLIVPIPGIMEDLFQPLLPELVGGMLASSHCPVCGQSIFDDAGATGYRSDVSRSRWWPSRNCANCDHDLSKRTAQDA